MKKIILFFVFNFCTSVLFAQADIVVVNTDGQPSYIAGQSRTYTITVTNIGPNTATNIVVQDLVQSGIPLSNVSWSGSNGSNGTGNLNDTIASLLINQIVTYTIVVNIPSNFSQTTNLVNTFTYISGTIDPTPTCSQCTDTDTPNPFADLQILKTNSQTEFLYGAPTTYTIQITNIGPSDAFNINVTDNMPPGITVMTWNGSNGTSGTGNLSNIVLSLAVGSTLTYTVTIQVPNPYNPVDPLNPTTTLVNLTNKVIVTSSTPDPTNSCSGCIDTDTPRPDYVTVNTTQYNVQQLIKNVLISSPCIPVTNISSQNCGFGYFNSNNSNFPIKEGLIIRSGQVGVTQGKYSGLSTSTDCGTGTNFSDPDLVSVIPGATAGNIKDATFVKFDFTPSKSTFSFDYVFASQEYGQFQCNYFDAFGFILTNLTTGAVQNLAVVPTVVPPTPVTVKTIRKSLYNNTCGDANPQFFGKYNINIPTEPNNQATSAINMRGQTVKLKASGIVVPGDPYSIKLVVADWNDQAFDIAVFIGSGIDLGDPKISDNPTTTGDIITLCPGITKRIYSDDQQDSNITYVWTKDGVAIGGNTYYLDINQPGLYTVTFIYNGGCSKSYSRQINSATIQSYTPPNNLVLCNNNVFNLLTNKTLLLSTVDPSIAAICEVNFALTEANATAEIYIPASQYGSYLGTNNQTIYMTVNDGFGSGCNPIYPFNLLVSSVPSGSFSYPDDGGALGFCTTSNSATPTFSSGFPTGGSYSFVAQNAGSTGFSVNSVSGVINFTSATAGNYTINYTIPAGACPAFAASTTVSVSACLITNMSPIASICEGSSVTLTTTDAGSGVTYTWSQGATLLGTTTVPTFSIPASSLVAGSYTMNVKATLGTETSAVSSQPLTVHPIPTASLPANFTTCSNQSTTFNITGTANAFVTYNDGSGNQTVQLNATGSYTITTPILTGPITYTLVDVKGNTTPNCLKVLSGSLTISVGAPTAKMIKTTDTVCSGSAGIAIAVTGSPNATVTYTINSGANQTLVLNAAGTGSIATGVLTNPSTPTVNFTLVSVITSGTSPCSATITGQQTIVTVNALPSAVTMTTATATVCPNTTGTLNFVGTAGDKVQFSDGINPPQFVVLGTSGTASVTTATLSTPTTYNLINVETPSTTCKTTLTGTVTITIDTPTSITTPPQSDTKCIGSTITLATVALGTNLSYQWTKNNVNLPTATTSSLTINPITPSDAGNYACIVTGKCGTVTSSTATLVVTPATVITTNTTPANQAICIGQPINLSIAATGQGLTYQWKNNAVNVTTAGTTATTNTLLINAALSTDAGTYTCVITDSCNNATTSTGATVTVNGLPNITAQSVIPANGVVCEGQPFSLQVTATTIAGLTYQWKRNGVNVGTNSNTYSVALANLTTDSGTYTCVVSGTCAPPVTSSAVTITVNQAPKITVQPISNTSICANQKLSLSVTATGTNLSYQWQKDGVNATGATATTKDLVINSAITTDSGNYTCVITSVGSSCASITSNVANVVVSASVVITPIVATLTICETETLNLTVLTSGGSNPTFQWKKDGVNIIGATLSTYSKALSVLSDSGNYTCEIKSGSCPAVLTNVCVVKINATPTATLTYGSTNAVCSNDPSSVRIDGTPNTKVTYTINGGSIKTAILDATGKIVIPTGNLTTSVTYTLTGVSTTVAPICSRTYNQSITITVNKRPTVVLEDGYICLDPITSLPTKTYNFKTNFDPTLYSFIWYKSNTILPGEVASNYIANSVGTYKVKVTNIATGCSNSDSAIIVASVPPTSASVQILTDYFATNASIVVTALALNGDFEYQLDYGPFQDSNVFEGIQNGEHSITVRDRKACGLVSKTFDIIDYPKFFTPNADGDNDKWNISSLSNQPNAKIYIFDKFGKLLKQISPQGEGWDGTFVGRPLPADDYWFSIMYSENQIDKEFKAHFSLKR